MIDLKLHYSKAQTEIFFGDLKKFNTVPKGKRLGLTRGAAQAFIEYAVDGKEYMLWGDTVNSNIDRYFERYFLPALKQLGSSNYKWNQQKHELTILNTKIDFRSADRPENWEGFGYNMIFLNEAGIILKNDYLFDNAVLPMLMDYPDSKLIAAGVPKGKMGKNGEHKFFLLDEMAKADETGDYRHLQYTSYDNPFLDKEIIEKMENVLDPETAKQEIYGEFLDRALRAWAYCFEEKTIEEVEYREGIPVYLSFDFNVDPAVCLVWQEGFREGEEWIHYIDEIYQHDSNVYAVCKEINDRYPGSHFLVTGDRTSKKREYTQKNNRINSFTIIKQELGLKDAQFKLPINPAHSFARTLVNSMLARHKGIRINKRCKELIKDLKYCESSNNDDIVKNQADRSHLLDAFVYSLNTYHHGFVLT